MTERKKGSSVLSTNVDAVCRRLTYTNGYMEHCIYKKNEVVMVQIDGLRRHDYIKFRDPQRM